MVKLNEVKAERIKVGLTQAEMAERIGCTATSYGSKERGQAAFSVAEIERFCDVCGISDPLRKADIFLS